MIDQDPPDQRRSHSVELAPVALPCEALELEIDPLPCLRLEAAALSSSRRRDLALEDGSELQ